MKNIKQSWNKNGILAFYKLLTDNKFKSLAIPHYSIQNISQIKWASLKESGIDGIIFDRDNTLTKPYSNQIYEPLKVILNPIQFICFILQFNFSFEIHFFTKGIF